MAVSQVKDNPKYWEKDPDKKDLAWGSDMVSLLRGEWVPIIDGKQAKENMDYLLSAQSLEKIKGKFKKASDFFQNTNWTAISVTDRLRHILIAEFLKAMHSPRVQAIDPSAENQRKKDRTRLATRRDLTGVMNDVGRRMGDPPFQLPENTFEGNVEMFDTLGLNDMIPEDREFYFETFYRLWHEITAQELLAAITKDNQFENYVEDLVNDILAKMCVTYRVYVSPFNGKIRWDYIKPETAMAIEGTQPDLKDAVCLGYQQSVTVRKFLDFAGPGFNWNRESDRQGLAKAINMANGTLYDYATPEGCFNIRMDDDGNSRHELTASRHQMMSFRVGIGYIEWKSVDQIIEIEDNKNGFFYPVDKAKDFQKGGRLFKPNERYSKEVSEYQRTYKTWFLASGLNTQLLFRFGPLYHQLSSGVNDEYSSFSIAVLRGKGKPPVNSIKHYVDIANEAFFKMLWAINESTPQATYIHYDSIASLITKIVSKPGGAQSMGIPLQPGAQGQQVTAAIGQVNTILDMYKNKLYRLYSTPSTEGQKLGGNSRPHYKDEGGIDPLAPAMQTVFDWAVAQVSATWGIAPLDAYTPDPKDGYKARMAAMQQSRNATYFIPFMINSVVKDSSTTSLNLTQDGIENETQVYTYIEQLMGEDAIASFKSLDKVPMHRYGIFVELFSVQEKRDLISQDAQIAFERKEISYGEKLMVQEIEDPSKAGMMLEFYRNRNERKAEQQQQAAHDRQMQLVQANEESQMRIIDRKGQWAVAEEKERGQWYMAAHQTPHDTAIQKKQMDIDNNRQKLSERTDEQLRLEEGKQNLKTTEPLPAT